MSRQQAGAGPAEPEPRVPVVVLTQFLAALRARDFTGAKVMAFRILCDEPDNEVVLRCLPQIDEYLAAEEAAEEEDESGEEEDDDDDDDDDDSDDSDDSEDGDDDEEAADGGGGEARKACNGASGAAKPAAKPAATQACLRAASDSAASAARPGAPATAPAAAASASSLERVEQLRAALGDQPAPPPSDVELKRALRGLVLTLVPPEEKVGAPKR